MATTGTATLQPPPLTFDDLIDLHFLLEADELFLTLLRESLTVANPAVGGDF